MQAMLLRSGGTRTSLLRRHLVSWRSRSTLQPLSHLLTPLPRCGPSLNLSLSLRTMASYRDLRLRQVYQSLVDQKPLSSSGEPAVQRSLESWESFREANTELLDEQKVSLPQFHRQLVGASGQTAHNPLRFDLTPEQIKELTEEVIRAHRAVIDSVAALKEGWTWNNTLGALDAVDNALQPFETMLSFPGQVSSDKEVRDAANEASKVLQQFGVEQSMRLDLYQSVLAFSQTEEAKTLEGERKRSLEFTLRDFRRNGLHLEESVRNQIKELKQRMSSLCIDFHKNVGEEDSTFEFTLEELEGLPQDKLDSLPKTEDGSKYILSLKYPDYFPVMDYVKVNATRHTLCKAYLSRCLEANTPILEEVVALRHKKAQLLGFGSHADFVLDVRMAKTKDAVERFLNDMSSRVEETSKAEFQYLLQLKEEECKATGREFDGKLHSHEFRYYLKAAERQRYNFDSNVVKPYFPLDQVLKGVFDMYQSVLGLRFEEVENPHVWHEDVRLFNVYNAELTEEEAKELPEKHRFDSRGLVGQFYTDVFPRPGKFSHAACFGLVPGHHFGVEGKHQHPIAAMVANFPPPTDDKPSLLAHSDVVTLVHEMGHVFHQLLTETELGRFAGTRVETDFVEAPSQMKENWAWEKEGVALLSGHYEDSSKKLPEEFLQKMLAAKNANIGLLTKRQLSFGMYDMYLHSRETVDTAAAWHDIQLKTMGIEGIPGTNFAASFGHLTGGYDAGYYGYLWSEVASADIFFTGFKSGKSVFDPRSGRRYRRAILSRGGTQDGGDMLRDFLGRDPELGPWMISKGLQQA